MTHLPIMQFIVAALVLAAAATDIHRRRIPNWLNLCGIMAGLLLRTIMGGWEGLKMSAAGLSLAFGVYFLLYCVRAMGAGDVKLMAAVGSIVGPANWIQVFVVSALAGGVFALVLVIYRKRSRETLWNSGFILYELAHFRMPYWRRSHLDVKDSRSLNMPHGVAIAAGTLVCLFLARLA